MQLSKPFSQACENNRQPILDIIQDWLEDAHGVLEIGSGTGQHAVYFAQYMPWLSWQTSDLAANHPGISNWLEDSGLDNVEWPLHLDVNAQHWPALTFDSVFTANTLHIMSWPEVGCLFEKLADIVPQDGQLIIYGPFNYQGRYTSASNAAFDQQLKSIGSHMGIRDIESVVSLASTFGMSLQEDIAMPANNRLLRFVRKTRD